MEYVLPTLFIEPSKIGNTYIIIDKMGPSYPDEPIETFSGTLTSIDATFYHFTNVNRLNKVSTIQDTWNFSPNKDQERSFEKIKYIFYDNVDDIPIDFKNCVAYYNMIGMETRMRCDDDDQCKGAECRADGGGFSKRSRKTKRKQTKGKKIKCKKTMQIQRRR
jgi:hypothetical protein